MRKQDEELNQFLSNFQKEVKHKNRYEVTQSEQLEVKKLFNVTVFDHKGNLISQMKSSLEVKQDQNGKKTPHWNMVP